MAEQDTEGARATYPVAAHEIEYLSILPYAACCSRRILQHGDELWRCLASGSLPQGGRRHASQPPVMGNPSSRATTFKPPSGPRHIKRQFGTFYPRNKVAIRLLRHWLTLSPLCEAKSCGEQPLIFPPLTSGHELLVSAVDTGTAELRSLRGSNTQVSHLRTKEPISSMQSMFWFIARFERAL